MLHDMVATHSVVRVSVCRPNNGLYLSVVLLLLFVADGHLNSSTPRFFSILSKRNLAVDFILFACVLAQTQLHSPIGCVSDGC